MGMVASVVRRKVKKPIAHYNVEERGMKVISRDKPIPAPPHPAMKQIMEEIKRDASNLPSSRTDPELLKKLSKVYITSQGVNPTIQPRLLPMDRQNPDELLYGYEDPKVIPPGKASLRQMMEIIANFTKDPETHSVEKIAKDYNLDIVDVMNLVQYTRTLLVHTPPKLTPTPEYLNPLQRFQKSIDNLKH